MSYIFNYIIPKELILIINDYLYDNKKTILEYLKIWKFKNNIVQFDMLCKYYNNPYQLYNIFSNKTNIIPCYYCNHFNIKSKDNHTLNECLSFTRNIMKYNNLNKYNQIKNN